MKSIKEKSEEYGLQYPIIHYDADGNTYDDVNKPSMDFEAGANYVISEIMDCFPHTLCMNPNEVISSIVTTINELRK